MQLESVLMKNKILNVNPGRKLAHFKHADNNPLHNLNLNIKNQKKQYRTVVQQTVQMQKQMHIIGIGRY